MKTAVQAAWLLLGLAMFTLAAAKLADMGAAKASGYITLGTFVLAWVTYRVYQR